MVKISKLKANILVLSCIAIFWISAQGCSQALLSQSPERVIAVLGDTGDWSSLMAVINQRTTLADPGQTQARDSVGARVELDKAKETSMEVLTNLTGNRYLRTTIRDGQHWKDSNYDRSEICYTKRFLADHKYQIEWKGSFPQALPSTGRASLVLQLHNVDWGSPQFSVAMFDGDLIFKDYGARADDATYGGEHYFLAKLSDIADIPLSFRLTFISSRTNGYLKFEMNDTVIVERHGKTSKTPGGDFFKGATLYDWGNALVSPSATLGRSYSLNTQSIRIVELGN